MTNSEKTRKYFSYTEIIESPELPFTNNSKDSSEILVADKNILQIALSDFIAIIKRIRSKELQAVKS